VECSTHVQLRFETGSYKTRGVLADGDCLFHAFDELDNMPIKVNISPLVRMGSMNQLCMVILFSASALNFDQDLWSA
jgi:hypothetical protein